MAIFYVFQGKTYKHEYEGGYVWSPQLGKGGKKNKGYYTMLEIKKGDFIIHQADTAIQAISIAKTDCYEAQQPLTLKNAKKDIEWDDEGYRVDLDYVKFDVPLNMRNYKDWLKEHKNVDSAFDVNGIGKLRYMCHVSNEHVQFLLGQALKFQESTYVIDIINRVIKHAKGVEEEDYTDKVYDADLAAAQKLTGQALQEKAKEASRRRVKPHKVTTTSYYRNPVIAKAAKERANGVCQLCGMPAPFEDEDGNPYLESHHIVWLSQGGEDTIENVAALCPNCHKRMHVLNEESAVHVLQSRNRDI